MPSSRHLFFLTHTKRSIKLHARCRERDLFKAKPRDVQSAENRYRSTMIRITICICTVVLFAQPIRSGSASPIATRSFDQLASSCAPGTTRSTLRAVAAVESHLDPLAIHDNSTHESLVSKNLPAAIALARNRIKLGHSVDIGLMQINNHNLVAQGMNVEDAFDACRSLAAGSRILLSAFTAGSSESERQAAILISLSRYNTSRALAGVANGYASEVIAAQSGSSADNRMQRDRLDKSTQWDIWGTSSAESTSWIVTTDGLPKIERAGAQSSDARNEGRASASQGEPYEALAYQESEPIRP